MSRLKKKLPMPYEVGIEYDQLHTIQRVLYGEFGDTQEVRAARALKAEGITSNQLHAYGKTAIGMATPDYWRINTYNELKHMEMRK